MNIEKFCKKYNLGNVTIINKITGGLMHKMFKVETDKNTYCIKVLNPEVMSRKEAYNNFVVSESISNLAKKNNIPASCALNIEGNYLTKLSDNYYMVFDYVEGKTLKDEEITINHCKKIGNVLAHIHNLDYKEIGLKPNIVKYKKLYDWQGYVNNPNFNKMSYKNLYLNNYKKYTSILKRANERYNDSNKNQTICHSDMDPKNVMWNNNNPIIIDWESASIANPERELLEVALCWSGFLTNNFNEKKFTAVFKEYSKYRNIIDIEWYNVICGNLVGRFGWLKYNLERSLGLLSNDKEEIKLAENEVIKTIDEINRYLDLIGNIYDIIIKLTTKETENYDNITNVKATKYLLEHTFNGLKINNIKVLGSGYDSVAYLINNEYVFKIKFSSNKKKGYTKEKRIYDFLNKNLNTNIKIPNIEYSYIDDEIEILGYKKIKGTFLTPELYSGMSKEEQNILKKDIANFLRQLHDLDYNAIKDLTISNKDNVLEEYQLLKETIYNKLTDIEKQYIEDFMTKLKYTKVFNDKKCLCHNDLGCNHLLIDKNNKLCGIIDFGDSGIIDEYCDFIYLLEDSEEEIGSKFGEEIINLYGNIDLNKAKEYNELVEEYYPIETIVYGIKNNKQDFIDKGRKEIYIRTHNNKKLRK